MSLKTDINMDIREVFLNSDDFADTRVVAGREIKCVFYEGSTAVADAAMGTVHDTYILHAATADLPANLKSGKRLVIDGSIYEVTDLREDYGMTALRLEADR